MTGWWRSHSVRVQLTLWYVAAVIVVLGVYISVVYAFVGRNASQNLDQQLRLVAADQHRVGHDSRAVLQHDAALAPDRQDRADEVLVRPHPSGDAVHHDAEAAFAHRGCSEAQGLR